jgi:hypothetical protein
MGAARWPWYVARLRHSTVHMAVCLLPLLCRLDRQQSWTEVGWLGSATPLPVFTTSCLPARPSDRCWETWLTEGWDAARVGSPGPLGGGQRATGLIWLLDK